MKAKKIKKLANELVGNLTRRTFLNQAGLSSQRVREIAGDSYWEPYMKKFFPISRRFTCEEIFEACRKPMEAMSPEPDGGWMAFTYQYVCHLLFPDEAFTQAYKPYFAGACFYLEVMQFFFDYEREALPSDRMVDLCFLDSKEFEKFESREEYRQMLKFFRKEYVYEMMRLNHEVTPFKTLEHIAGVHWVAMYMARGLYEAGIPIDLTLVSGAAACHDLGKFGCKPDEAVPHMHYFYTNQWCQRHGMDYIGHIAANHSTWDLEPERLSVESLVLIYADFRVKQYRNAQGETYTHIASLEEAFQTILDKLENVDEAKYQRYRFVYSRLHDFRDYMLAQGIDTTLTGKKQEKLQMPELTLRSIGQTLTSLVHLGVENNIAVMHRMSAERQFGNFLEAARSEKNLRNLRAYLNLFDLYSPYTNDNQKKQTLSYLYELLMYKEGEIRTEAARLIGKIIAQFNFGYRKRFPKGMEHFEIEQSKELLQYHIQRILHPSHKLNDLQKRRIRVNLRNVFTSVLRYAHEENRKEFLDVILACYKREKAFDHHVDFVLLIAVSNLPLEELDDEGVRTLGQFIYSHLTAEEVEVCVAAWIAAQLLIKVAPEEALCRQIIDLVQTLDVSLDVTKIYLKYEILKQSGLDVSEEQRLLFEHDVISDIFLDNLKTGVPWIEKAANIQLLKNQLLYNPCGRRLHIATHLSNLIKLDEIIVVPRDAGNALLDIFPLLQPDERNEVVVELICAIESGDAESPRHISEYLALTALWLPESQFEEVIRHLKELIASPNEGIAIGALVTVGVLLEHFQSYHKNFDITEENYRQKQSELFATLLKAAASSSVLVNREAMLALGRVFSSSILPLEEKNELFILGYRKLLYLLQEEEISEISMFCRASAISAVSQFISRWRMQHDRFDIPEWKKVAFFPGTFDPFTCSHKQIVSEILKQGFEVFLSVDEFSWSKKTQPHLIRQRIVNMSIADEFHVHIFPHKIPVNIANPEDLAELRSIFKDTALYMVVGSDVVLNASSYRKAPEPNSIHSMNHIVFRRGGDEAYEGKQQQIRPLISGDLFELELPKAFEHISSTMLRENVDMNRDISSLIDPLGQNYVYQKGLYLREPENKPLASGRVINFEKIDRPDDKLLEELFDGVFQYSEEHLKLVKRLKKTGDKLIVLRNMQRDNAPIGVIRLRYILPEDLYDVLGSVELADRVRRNTMGNILLINGIHTINDALVKDTEQLLLAEAIAESFLEGCGYALFYPKDNDPSKEALAAIARQGFLKAENFSQNEAIYMVDMHEPIVMMRNLQTTIKEPMASDPNVVRMLEKTHEDLQLAMTRLYPGQLVLSVSSVVIYPRLVEMITNLNGVPNQPTTPRQLGEAMCVPFSRILRDKVVPNTVTKTLHTDRVFDPALKGWTVKAFPNYMPLEDQIRTIRSFNRPIILVDDILNNGQRFCVMEPILRDTKVEIKKMVLAVVTGQGQDRLSVKNIEAESVYYIPNVRRWLIESALYPFIGGDSIDRSEFSKVPGLNPSVNRILPYTDPHWEGASQEAVFEFSECCVRNAREIFLALEESYRTHFGRNLTLERLSEAIIVPSAPDRGECMEYDPNLSASIYIDNDLKMLRRTR